MGRAAAVGSELLPPGARRLLDVMASADFIAARTIPFASFVTSFERRPLGHRRGQLRSACPGVDILQLLRWIMTAESSGMRRSCSRMTRWRVSVALRVSRFGQKESSATIDRSALRWN